VTVFLIALLAVGAWLLSLYVRPFSRCPRCLGRGNMTRGNRRPVCPLCHGLRRRQRIGSRTVHQLARRVRRELDRHRQQRAAAAAHPEPKE
jgi:hypothetical protein